MIYLLKDLKYDDLISVNQLEIYKLVWKTNYNMVEDYWMFDEILRRNKLHIWINDNEIRIEINIFNGHDIVTHKVANIDIEKCTTQNLIDYKNSHQNYVERLITELGKNYEN